MPLHKFRTIRARLLTSMLLLVVSTAAHFLAVHFSPKTSSILSATLMVLFVGISISLWLSIVPGLQKLARAAEEFKSGNFAYRLRIRGKSETEQLARAFNEMADSLADQNQKLQELVRMKTDFVSTVSHELRTPLSAIKGSIELVTGGVLGPVPPEALEMLEITKKNTDRLVRLINDVLDIAKIEAGAIKVSFEKVSITREIERTVRSLDSVAAQNGVRLRFIEPRESPLVVLDPDRFEQVLVNLLSNAIKFSRTKQGQTPKEVTVELEAQFEDKRVVIRVSDEGEGIPEEFLARIFDKFTQARIRHNEGTGLGLAISKAIVEEHGGSIWVESKSGAGSSFSFSIPWNGALVEHLLASAHALEKEL